MLLTQPQKEQIAVMRKNKTYLQVKKFFKDTYGINLTGWDIRRICKEVKNMHYKERILRVGYCWNCLHFKTRVFKRKKDIEEFLRVNSFITSANRLYSNLKKPICYCEFFKTPVKIYIFSQRLEKLKVSDCSLYENMDE